MSIGYPTYRERLKIQNISKNDDLRKQRVACLTSVTRSISKTMFRAIFFFLSKPFLGNKPISNLHGRVVKDTYSACEEFDMIAKPTRPTDRLIKNNEKHGFKQNLTLSK